MTWIVDASVAAKWFFQEELTPQARDLLREGGDLIAPEIVLLEVENVAWQRVLRGEISDAHARAVAATLPQMFARLVPLIEVAGGALELALTLRHPVYDCAYLALAETSGLPLITADDRLLAQASAGNWPGRATHLRSFTPTPI